MTIFVICQLIVTLDSIRNSCDVFTPNSRDGFRPLKLPEPLALSLSLPLCCQGLPQATALSTRYLSARASLQRPRRGSQIYTVGSPPSGSIWRSLLPAFAQSYCHGRVLRRRRRAPSTGVGRDLPTPTQRLLLLQRRGFLGSGGKCPFKPYDVISWIGWWFFNVLG